MHVQFTVCSLQPHATSCMVIEVSWVLSMNSLHAQLDVCNVLRRHGGACTFMYLRSSHRSTGAPQIGPVLSVPRSILRANLPLLSIAMRSWQFPDYNSTKAGSEVMVDYNWGGDSTTPTILCECGARNCSGRVGVKY